MAGNLKYLPQITVSGDAFWVGTQQPDKFDAKGRYSMIVGNLSDAEIKKIEATGAKVNFNPSKDYQGKFIKAKTGVKIAAYDLQGNPMGIVPNNSKITVTLTPAKYDFAGKEGINFWVDKKGVTVVEVADNNEVPV